MNAKNANGLDNDVAQRVQPHASRHGPPMEEDIVAIRRQALDDPDAPGAGLGSRIAARFAGQGLTEDLPELHGQAPQPARFEP